MVRWLLPLLVLSCGGPEPVVAPLEPVDQLIRVSMAVRGERPTPEELDRIRAEPEALEALLDGWLASEAFGRTIRDMHAEAFQTRTDTLEVLPIRGALEGHTLTDSAIATSEPPLRLVEDIVLGGRPYTEIVTSPYTFANETVARMWFGVPFDADGPEWQKVRWTDGRPPAGVLASNAIWRRHVSNGSNFNRLRANHVASTLLCDEIGNRDVRVEGGIDLSDELAVSAAVQSVDSCVGCHQALDPLAAYLFGFKDTITALGVDRAYQLDCRGTMPGMVQMGPVSHFCYPIRYYIPSDEGRWDDWALRPPAYYGQPGRDLAALGESIAADPRFASCTARRFYSYFAQADPEEVPHAVVLGLQNTLIEAGFDARQLVKAIVLSEGFLTHGVTGPVEHEPLAGLQSVRPEQYARVVEQLTGFRWLAEADSAGCAPDCWGTVDLSESDFFGYRAMAGGTDGFNVLRPTHTATPTKVLVIEQLAINAAGYVVDRDLRVSEPRLLTLVDRDTVDEGRIRVQLVALFDRMLGQQVEADSPEIDGAWALWVDAGGGENNRRAWTQVVWVLLQDPRLLFY